MSNTDNNNRQTEEVTLDDVILAGQRFVKRSWKNWYVYLITFVLIGGYLFYSALTEPVTYNARITVMRQDDDAGGVSGVASILGQFGLGRPSSFNIDKLLELARSRRIVTEMLFDSARIDNTDDYLANHLISEYALDQVWKEKDEVFDGFRFDDSKVDSFSGKELAALKRVYGYVVGSENREGLITADYSDLSSIISLSAETTSEDLSISMINTLFESLSAYYVKSATQKQFQTYTVVKQKSDSIGAALQTSELEYARFRDANQGLYSNVANLKAERLSRDITRLNVVYAEALKNVELADFALKNATPVITALDRPVPPLKPLKPSYFKTAALAVFLSLVAAMAWIFAGWFISYSRTVIRQ